MRRTIASVFGVGLLLGKVTGSDAGSGTLGAAVGLAAGMAAGELGWPAQLLLAVLVTGVSVWASQSFSDDPGWVVIDEAAGATLAVVGLGLAGGVAGWVMFRVVDITKTGFPGVRWAERLPGGWGITGDDVVAGAYGLAVGWIVQLWLG
ncbi:MAG: phosphatidylglycerophosphatase A [Acidimicrobiia bacterium]|nr:phosphatidylglycerophosphatase A [Acidimicrobiia bacterium]